MRRARIDVKSDPVLLRTPRKTQQDRSVWVLTHLDRSYNCRQGTVKSQSQLKDKELHQ